MDVSVIDCPPDFPEAQPGSLIASLVEEGVLPDLAIWVKWQISSAEENVEAVQQLRASPIGTSDSFLRPAGSLLRGSLLSLSKVIVVLTAMQDSCCECRADSGKCISVAPALQALLDEVLQSSYDRFAELRRRGDVATWETERVGYHCLATALAESLGMSSLATADLEHGKPPKVRDTWWIDAADRLTAPIHNRMPPVLRSAPHQSAWKWGSTSAHAGLRLWVDSETSRLRPQPPSYVEVDAMYRFVKGLLAGARGVWQILAEGRSVGTTICYQTRVTSKGLVTQAKAAERKAS